MTDDVARKMIAVICARAWITFTKNERNLVRFGLFPHDRTEKIEAEVREQTGLARDVTRLVACALMDCAKADGGMRA